MLQFQELDEVPLVLNFGFQSLDEDETLLSAYPTPIVMLNNKIIFDKVSAGSCPVSFGRKLRPTVLGDDGLTDDMIGAENSSNRKEASKELTTVFFGITFFFHFSDFFACLYKGRFKFTEQ